VPQIDQLISVKGKLIDGRDLTSRQLWKLIDTPVFAQVRSEVYTKVMSDSAFRTQLWLQLREQMYEIR
jgi:hypothetical protein